MWKAANNRFSRETGYFFARMACTTRLGWKTVRNIVKPDSGLEVAAQRLIDLAKERDGRDNISVQLIRIKEVERSVCTAAVTTSFARLVADTSLP